MGIKSPTYSIWDTKKSNGAKTISFISTESRMDLPKTFKEKLEMTERVMMDGNVALDTLVRFDELGYKLSIDDFGTGFSSLQYLFRMPLDNIKIDRSFVRDMMKDDKALAIVKSLIYLAQSLKMQVIAEGIEKEEEKHLLKALGVDFGQGFLFSKAIPLDELIKKISTK